MPTNHLSRLFVIGFVLFFGLWAIFPSLVVSPVRLFDPSVPFAEKHNLKPGIDMVGGTSLLYEIKPPEGGYSEGLAQRVMDALKKRVDPDGVRNLVWRPQGDSRLEIQMPLSGRGENAGPYRTTLAKAQSDLEGTNLRMNTLLDAIERLSGEARDQRLAALAMDSVLRQRTFGPMARAADEIKAARARKDAAAEAKAELEFAKLKTEIEPTNIDVAALESALNTIEAAKERIARGDTDAKPASVGVMAVIDASRNRDRNFPTRQAAIDAYIKAHADFFKVRNQLDDAADLKRLLQGSGVLEYFVLVSPADSRVPEMLQRLESGQGTSVRSGDSAKWAVVDKPEQFRADGVIRDYLGRTWVLLDTRPEKSLTQKSGAQWALKSATPQTNPQRGDTEVAFQLDAQGGIYMGRLTAANIKQPMAIVLDDRVISAPTIQSQINDSGVITGSYTPAEIKYLVNTLNAGSLPARLADEPISERTVGPQLGADNLRAGFLACGFGLVAVAVFLIGYYYLAGVVAYIAVCINLLLILGTLAALNSTFTLPSVAALVLTLGSAVDSNVLIFERLREEQQRGFPIRMALRNSYDRAFSAIVDSNVVTGLTSIVLYIFGSEEVKGFGLTLLLGIVTSLFTSLFVTKTIFAILVDNFGVKRLGCVPMTFPWWERLLKPNIDWMRKVWILGLSSGGVMLAGLVLFGVYIAKGQMFDIEFSSGTAVTIELKTPLEQKVVREMLDNAADKPVVVASTGGTGANSGGPSAGATPERRTTVAEALPAAQPVAVGTDNLTWEIVTPNPDVALVRSGVLEVFGTNLKIAVPSSFDQVGVPFEQAFTQTVLPVEASRPTIAGKFVPEQWGEYRGGAAIFLNNLDPPMSPDEIRTRLTAQRLQPGQSKTVPAMSVYAPTRGNEPTTEAVVMLVDERLDFSRDEEKWRQDIAVPAWNLVNEAVNRPPTLSKVTAFNPQVAGGTQQDAMVALVLALVAIMGYIWFRFGNLRYGTATVIALLHDTFFVLGAIGFAHLLADTAVGQFLLLEPFRVNLTVVAAVLTVMGYSMADTIVVFDRIREIRGQRGALTSQVVNDAINQTLSRTLLTAGTTLATLFVMYLFGGAGIHGFTYVLLLGILVGTYSSIAIAAPILLLGLPKAGGETGKSEPTTATDSQLQRA